VYVAGEGLLLLQQPAAPAGRFGHVAFAAKINLLYQGLDALVAHAVEALAHAVAFSAAGRGSSSTTNCGVCPGAP
jgi:hypothetical protein